MHPLSETDTGVKWIDGKTIYRKVIDFGALPDTGNNNVAHGISSYDTVIKLNAMTYESMNMKNYVVVQKNKDTGEERLFLNDCGWNVSLKAAELAADIRRHIVSNEYDIFIKEVPPVC